MTMKETAESYRFKALGFYWCVAWLIFFQVPSAFAKELPPLAEAEIDQRAAELTPVPWDGFLKKSAVIELNSSCPASWVELHVGDPQTGQIRLVWVKVRVPVSKGPVPVVLIIPTIEGVTTLEPHLAKKMCAAGFASIIASFHTKKQPVDLPAWGYEDIVDRGEILALRTVLDFAAHNPAFDSKHIGVMGLSLGGIMASMLAGLEADRLDAVVTAVGAGNMPYILSHSDNIHCRLLRERRMQVLHLSNAEEYEDLLEQNFRYDPMYFAPRVKTERIMMVLSTADTKVPYEVQQETYLAFGRPEQMLFHREHVETLISLVYFNLDPVMTFLQNRFHR